MTTAALRWRRGRVEEVAGAERAREWLAVDDRGETIARVVRVPGPLLEGWRVFRAVALDDDARLIELRPPPPDGAGWLATIGGQVVGRAPWPLQAVRRVEDALASG